MEQAPDLGHAHDFGRLSQSEGERWALSICVGRRRVRRRRQHRLGHCRAATAAPTSCGIARDASGANIVWEPTLSGAQSAAVTITSCGEPTSSRAHRSAAMTTSSGTDCGGADCRNIIWGTHGDDNIVRGTARGDDNIVWHARRRQYRVGTNGDDNTCGARRRRQHRLGHQHRQGHPRGRQHRVALPGTTTLSGARAATTTSCGAPQRRRYSSCGAATESSAS